MDPVLPDYGGACLTNVTSALLDRSAAAPPWLPAPVRDAAQVVLFVLDGLGWHQLQERTALAPTIAGMAGGPITSVAPTTTATALTSITTGAAPALHGVVGYRVKVGPGDVMNVLRWRTGAGDARDSVIPGHFQSLPAFRGMSPPVVTRAEFAETGFTRAHLAEVRLSGWRVASSLVVNVAEQLQAGEPFVYAYYDGIDKVAHEHGFGPHYDAELAAVDRLVADLLAALPDGAVLAVTADHGQVAVGERVLQLHPDVLASCSMLSGEGRFRWLHAEPGHGRRLADAAREHHGAKAWVRTRAEAEEEGWFGGPLPATFASRLGDVVVAPFDDVAYLDPADTGEVRLQCRHGSLTPAEMVVPFLAGRG